MDYKHTIDILSENIRGLEILVNGFDSSKKISPIEIDLLLDKTRNLYDVLLMLKQNAVRQPVDESSGRQEKEPAEKDLSESTTNKITGPSGQEIARTPAENTGEENPDNRDENNGRTTRTTKKEATKMVTDNFGNPPSSLHDNLAKSRQYSDLSSKLQSKPISDIANAIGINDKFSFIHELFRDDTRKYEETIQVLNSATDFNEAYNFLIENYSWDMDDELVQKILELIRRKLITGRNE